MADSSKPPKNAAPADSSRIAKPIRSTDAPLGETARAADSVPAPGGPFATLPIQFGRYEIRKELGRGQMGAVYLANDIKLDRLVALKVARVSASGSAKLLKRMEIEGKSAAKVDHPHICKVYDAGVIDGIRFIALQYIEGEDLKKYMKRLGRKRDPEEAIRLILQILQALEAAHDQGVIHRDLKPENIMLNLQNEPVIMDFGLARKTIASSDAGLTQGMIVGTAAYMSPEQATGKAEGIDHRSDLYAVGVMLFEMLTGEWPFTGGAIEVMGKKCFQEPPSPMSSNPSLNPKLAAVCHKMIAKQRGDRYVTCAEVVTALEAIDLIAAIPVTPVDEAIERKPSFGILSQTSGAKAIRHSSTNIDKKIASVEVQKTPLQKSKSDNLRLLTNWWNVKPPVMRWTALGGAGTCLLALAAIVLFPTDYGVVRIEIDDPKLSVRFEGSTITMENDRRSMRVTPTGKHTLAVFQDGSKIESSTQSLKVKRGDKHIVKVSLFDGKAFVHVDGIQTSASSVESIQPIQETNEPNSPEYQSSITSKSAGMKLRLIPAGTFQMGSPKNEIGHRGDEPQLMVEISAPFYIGVTEVTQGEYLQVVGTNPSRFSPTGSGSDAVRDLDTRRFPVEQVSWYDAIEFCNKLSDKDELRRFYDLSDVRRQDGVIRSAIVAIAGGDGYRLPFEEEWEYACRAMTTTPFHFGEILNGETANVNGHEPYGTTTTGQYLQRTTVVGSYLENKFGLFDMHGNVDEICFDWFNRSTIGDRERNSKAPVVTNGSDNILVRGGYFDSPAISARSACQLANKRANRSWADGFRVARNVGDRDILTSVSSNNNLPGNATDLRSRTTQTIDVLKEIDLKRDVVSGEWRFIEGELLSPAGMNNAMRLPFLMHENYRLTILARRVGVADAICFGISVDSTPVVASLDSKGKFTGLEWVKGRPLWDGAPHTVGQVFKDDAWHEIEIRVKGPRVEIVCDKRLIFDQIGGEDMSVPDYFNGKLNSSPFFLSTWTQFRIRKFEAVGLTSAEGVSPKNQASPEPKSR